MASTKPKHEGSARGGTPTEADRKVLKRAEEPADVPEVTEVDGGEKIEPVDLSLHGDKVIHWQDEPLSARKSRRAREGKVPSRDTDK